MSDHSRQIAETIGQQMGGIARLRTMTGAKNFLAMKSGLQFDLPARTAKDGIVRVHVILNGKDLYDVRGFKSKREGGVPMMLEVATHEDIYADMLMDTFEKMTDLYLTLAPRR